MREPTVIVRKFEACCFDSIITEVPHHHLVVYNQLKTVFIWSQCIPYAMLIDEHNATLQKFPKACTNFQSYSKEICAINCLVSYLT